MTLSEELTWRGFVNQTTFKDLTALDGDPITFYWGVDPSADSMTIGNLAAAMMVKAFIKHGHKPVLLVGGATGMIGDPDGKAEERNLKSIEEIRANKAAIVAQYHQLFGTKDIKVVDNYDWFKDIDYLGFLRDVGKHVPMRQMLAREFVQTRLSEAGAGISYAEFSYVLIQAYDFLHLYEHHDVSLQVCGSDQWGNCIAGVDLIRRKTGGEAHVYSVPLIVNKSTGRKFGKSEAGAIWLDAKKTSIYQFYQFWLNLDDEGVEDYLKVFTDLDKNLIVDLTQRFNEDRGSRLAQKTLAFEVTKLVHGEAAAQTQEKIAAVLFGGSVEKLSQTEFNELKNELQVVRTQPDETLVQVIVKANLAASNSEATRFISSGAIYLNGEKVVPGVFKNLPKGDHLLRRGKNNFAIIEVE